MSLPGQTDIPDDSKARAKEALQKLLNDVTSQREEIDKLNQSIVYLVEKMKEIANVVDNQSALLKGEVPKIATAPGSANISHLTTLKEILDSKIGEKLIDRLFPEPPTGGAFLPAEKINEHLQKSMLGNFELGEALIDQLKTKVIGKALTKTVSGIVSEHGPG